MKPLCIATSPTVIWGWLNSRSQAWRRRQSRIKSEMLLKSPDCAKAEPTRSFDMLNRRMAAWRSKAVNEEGIITIEALNSKGKAVKCVLGDPNAVGIRQTVNGHTASPQKRIEQGRLVILKDGIRYNAIGMEVK